MASTKMTKSEQAAFDRCNVVRAGYGLDPLIFDTALYTVAKHHAAYQASNGLITDMEFDANGNQIDLRQIAWDGGFPERDDQNAFTWVIANGGCCFTDGYRYMRAVEQSRYNDINWYIDVNFKAYHIAFATRSKYWCACIGGCSFGDTITFP